MKPNDSVVKVGVAGGGYWGPKLLRNLNDAPNTELAWFADLDQSRLDSVSQSYPSVKVTRDYNDLLKSDIDAIVIATPVSTHFKIAQDSLFAGKHVFVEKPLADSTENATTLTDLAEKSDLRLMVGHVFEYNPAVELLRNLIQTGELGDILYIDAVRATLGLFQRDINVIWDLAPHDFSILRYILGADPISVSAVGESYIRDGIEDVAYISAVYPEKILAHIRVSWLEPRKQRHMTVVGSKKMVLYDDAEPVEKIKVFDVGVEFEDGDPSGAGQLRYRYGDISSPRIDSIEPLQAEIRHFIESIRNGTEPRSGKADGLEVVRCLESSNLSLKNGGSTVQINRDRS